jgi:LysR family glycine cleavage system transcriptional activator
VLSPSLQAELNLQTPACLLDVPLVHHSHRPWGLWFRAHGLQPPPIKGLVLDDSVMVLEAAAQGLGVALARSGLIEQDLRTGRLVKPFDGVASELGMWVVWRADSRKLRRIEALRDWLCEEARDAAAAEESEAA